MTRLRCFLPLLLGLSACGAEPAASVVEPVFPLPRLWTLGPAAKDLPEPRLEVTLTGDGRILVGGEELGYEGLRDRLEAFADETRDLDHPYEVGTGLVVLRCHRLIRWRSAQYVMMAAGAPSVRLLRLVFAVTSPEGGPEGTFALFLPVDRGLGGPRRDPGDRGWVLDVPTRTDHPVVPAALTAALRGPHDSRSEGAGVHLQAWANVPVEYVLQVADLLHRDGVTELHLGGAPPPDKTRGPLFATSAKTRGVRPGLRLHGEDLPRGSEEEMVEPEVLRHDGLAGFTEPPPQRHLWYFMAPSPWPEADPALDPWRIALAAMQGEDGSWGAGDVALTGLALLALLRSGATHKKTAWKKSVREGLRFPKLTQAETGSFAEDGRAHALASAAMAEAYARTHSPLFKQSARLALDHSRDRALAPPARAWLGIEREVISRAHLDFPEARPANGPPAEVGGLEGRILAALSGSLGAASLAVWQEELRAEPLEGRTAEDLAQALLVLTAK